MKIKEKLRNLKNNTLNRTLVFSAFSIIITFAFAMYNLFLSIKYRDAFAIGISIYYFLSIIIKSVTFFIETKISKKDELIKTKVRIKNYAVSSVLIFAMDFCLIAPIILMVTNPKDVNFGLIPAIVMAVYAVYKITFAIINYNKSKKSKNLTVILFKEINIIEAIVSILTLQHTLIMVNGGMNGSMRTLSFLTSIMFIVIIVLFSVLSFCKNRKIKTD